MIAYQTDQNGFFVSEVERQAHPFRENEWLLPAGAVETKPPIHKENEIAKWNGKSWQIERNFKNVTLYHKETKQEFLNDSFMPDFETYTEIKPPLEKENESIEWVNNKWEILPDYSDTVFYGKTDKAAKYFQKGENPDFQNYTIEKPLINEVFQKWNENTKKWEVDLVRKEENDLKIRQMNIQRLLLESDYIELPSFLERKGQSVVDQWKAYRASLRMAYHDKNLSIPEKPVE